MLRRDLPALVNPLKPSDFFGGGWGFAVAYSAPRSPYRKRMPVGIAEFALLPVPYRQSCGKMRLTPDKYVSLGLIQIQHFAPVWK